MRNKNDEYDDHDYSPNELAALSISHKDKYEQIVNSNLYEGDFIPKWEMRNMDRAKERLENKGERISNF